MTEPKQAELQKENKMGLTAEQKLDYARSGLMKLFALGLADVAIPREFWMDTLMQQIYSGVLDYDGSSLTNPSEEPKRLNGGAK